MDEQLIESIENATLGYAVLYGHGENENFFLEDGWTMDQIQNFSDSVDGLIVTIIATKTISLDEVFGED